MMGHALTAAEDRPLVWSYMDRPGKIAPEQVAEGFGMSKSQLAETAGLARETLYRAERSRGASSRISRLGYGAERWKAPHPRAELRAGC